VSTVSQSVRVFAPATIGNIGPGLDILGLAVTGPGDQVEATRSDAPRVRILDPGHPDLPVGVSSHTSGIAATEVLRRAGASDVGIDLTVVKGLPLSGGQGGSAASAVAAAVAVNTLLGNPLSSTELLAACLVAESKVAGRHLDNIAPCLLGGCTLIRSLDPCDVYKIPTPSDLRVVLVHPHQQMRTAEGRAVLPEAVSRDTAMTQAAHVAALITAFVCGDYELLTRSIHDEIAEPVRAPLLTGFVTAKENALQAGALGCSISGSGPTAFAFAKEETAGAVATAMRVAYASHGVACDVHVCAVDPLGACVL